MASPTFDRQFKLVTSYLVSPVVLAGIRLLIGLYVLVGLVFMLVWEGTKTKDIDSFFSYFTNLTYIGICAYFFASGVQTLFYARNLKNGQEEYPLQSWPRFLRYLHRLLLTTIVTYPLLVTIVYWVLLSSSSTFATPFSAWSNISKHALNSVYAIFEIVFTNVEPMPWVDLPATIVILCGYLGVAYITHATQGIYTYSFLDPKKQGKKLAAYIVGIAVGQVIIFLIVFGVVRLRQRLTARGSSTEVEHEKLRGSVEKNETNNEPA
ncbi:hypothetical protein GALMADRAFT_253687 [Galerina marginata CBS 339.88]|uniref:FAR-17a/AIG1-like protein n=1 Tax=Galerina marginata (strain CBS 339.88) TaxID=685588 RepID=A0A067SYR6_GALM3|nr:hypothetical protein GALMADRAFT_253687 [Galerina marginata CBS 339.88]